MKLSRLWPVALATALIGISACGESVNDPGPPAPAGQRMKPLVEQFKDARTRAKSDFERSAFDHAIATGKIDYAAYEESSSRYRQCVADAGITETYTKLPNGIYRVDSEPSGADPQSYLKITGDCADSTGLARLEALYRTQVDNPDLLADPRLVVVRCLIKAGLVPPDYTTDKLIKFLDSKDLAVAGDFDPMNAEAQKCLTAGGIAIDTGAGQTSGS